MDYTSANFLRDGTHGKQLPRILLADDRGELLHYSTHIPDLSQLSLSVLHIQQDMLAGTENWVNVVLLRFDLFIRKLFVLLPFHLPL